DRSGATPGDGGSHNGMCDVTMLRSVPGARLAAPRDEASLRDALRTAVDVDDAPTVVRYPKGAVGEPIPAVEELDGVDVVGRFVPDANRQQAPVTRRVLVVGVGSMTACAMETGAALAAHGVE